MVNICSWSVGLQTWQKVLFRGRGFPSTCHSLIVFFNIFFWCWWQKTRVDNMTCAQVCSIGDCFYHLWHYSTGHGDYYVFLKTSFLDRLQRGALFLCSASILVFYPRQWPIIYGYSVLASRGWHWFFWVFSSYMRLKRHSPIFLSEVSKISQYCWKKKKKKSTATCWHILKLGTSYTANFIHHCPNINSYSKLLVMKVPFHKDHTVFRGE